MSEQGECKCEDREDVYDEHIGPLVVQIVEICKAAKIPFVCSFGLARDDSPNLMITSASFGGDCAPNDNIVIAYHVLTNDSSPLLAAATRRTES
jgi:hypothetical protein